MTTTSRPLGEWLADDYEVVARIYDNMPTGLTVSDDGRVFVSFPRWGDDVPFTVGELVDGRIRPYPTIEMNHWKPGDPAGRLVSVQSVVVDPAGRLWLLDTGAPEFGPIVPGGVKLVEIDLASNSVVRVIHPSEESITDTTYLNDVRFDLSVGLGGFAYITDSQESGGLVVVDLASGRSWAKLRGHASTRAVEGFRAMVQGEVREGYRVGSDGIALSADGARLFFSSLSSRRLYSVATAALRDELLDDDAVAETLVDLGDKGASDGLEADAEGAVYATAVEHSAVIRRDTDGRWTTLVHGPDVLWPDTLSLASDGHLYVSVNQLPRSPLFNGGSDDRIPPYLLIRTRVDRAPVRLAASATTQTNSEEQL